MPGSCNPGGGRTERRGVGQIEGFANWTGVRWVGKGVMRAGWKDGRGGCCQASRVVLHTLGFHQIPERGEEGWMRVKHRVGWG